MGKVNRKVVDGGIDLDRTREQLVAYLIDHGVDSARIPPKPNRSLPVSERVEAEWNRAEAVASVHLMLHGVPARVRGANGEWETLPRCHLKKCNLGGVSFALQELCDHWRNRERGHLESAVAELLAQVESIDPALLVRIHDVAAARIGKDKDALCRLVSDARELERLGDNENAEIVLSAAGNGARMVARSRLAMDRSLAAVNGLRTVAIQLRAVLAMIHPRYRKESARRRGGRPKQTLRKALLQHLKEGGLSYAAMNELVVGAATSRRPAEVRNQLHQAVSGSDARSIHPYRD